MGAPVLGSAASRRFPTTHGHRVLAPALVVLGVGAVFGSWVTGRVASGSVAVSYLVVSCRQPAPDDKGATPQAEAACDCPGRDDLFLSVVANLARFHREHEKHYGSHRCTTRSRCSAALGRSGCGLHPSAPGSPRRAKPPTRMWTMNIGAREKVEINMASATSFAGERLATWERTATAAYADREPPQMAQLKLQPRELSSIVEG